jgi:hypothetical protein
MYLYLMNNMFDVNVRVYDHPQLHHGGWINNRLEPVTTYYYRVTAVDRWNNDDWGAVHHLAIGLRATANDGVMSGDR